MNRPPGKSVRIRAIRGQAIPYFLFMMVILILSWGMMLNIARLLTCRMALQNAADNAALSAAVNQARTVNLIAKINEMISRVLYDSSPAIDTFGLGALYPETIGMGAGGGVPGRCVILPATFQLLRNNASRVASTIDVEEGYRICRLGLNPVFVNERCATGAQAMRVQFWLLVNLQEGLAKLGPAQSGVIARHIARRQGTGASREEEDGSVKLSFFGSAAEGILQGSGADIEGSEMAKGHLKLGLKRNETKIEFYGAKHAGVTLPSGKHGHYVYGYKIGDNRIGNGYKAWYYADRSQFHKKKINVLVSKNAGKGSDKGYPVFGKWLGIEWPDLKAAASAACYNTSRDSSGGPGFVLKDKPWRGEEIRENIRAYDDSRDDGWYAHLVPVGGLLH